MNIDVLLAGNNTKRLSDIIRQSNLESGDNINPIICADTFGLLGFLSAGQRDGGKSIFRLAVIDEELDTGSADFGGISVVVLTEEIERNGDYYPLAGSDGKEALYIYKYQKLSGIADMIVAKLSEPEIEPEAEPEVESDTYKNKKDSVSVLAFYSPNGRIGTFGLSASYASALGEAGVSTVYISIGYLNSAGEISPDEMRTIIETAKNLNGVEEIIIDLGGAYEQFARTILSHEELIDSSSVELSELIQQRFAEPVMYDWTENGLDINVTVVKEAIDKPVLKTMGFSKPVFVPEFTNAEQGDKYIMKYKVGGDYFVKLSRFPYHEINPLNFTALMRNLTNTLANCGDYFMNPFNFIIHEDYIYVKNQMLDIRLIYVPFNESICSEAELCESLLRVSRSFAKPDDEWRQITSYLAQTTADETSLGDITDAFNRFYEEYNTSQASEAYYVENTAEVYHMHEQVQEEENKREEQVGEYKEEQKEEPIYEPELESEPVNVYQYEPAAVKEEHKQEYEYIYEYKEEPIYEPEPVNVYKSEPAAEDLNASLNLNFHVYDEFDEEKTMMESSLVTHTLVGKAKPVDFMEFKTEENGGYLDPVFQQSDSAITSPPPAQSNIYMMVSARLDYCGPPEQRLPRVIRIEPRNGLFSIGKMARGKSTCDYAFSDGNNKIDKKHAQIKEQDGRYFISDLNSKYGTYVNRNRIPPQQAIELRDGDIISFSTEVMYEFRIEKPR